MTTTETPTPDETAPPGETEPLADVKHTLSAMKTFLVSGVGTGLEFYDFLIYGLAAALAFGKVFFPSEDPWIGIMLGFATFGTGFFARPVGGMVIGHFGDKIGRRKMLILTLILMGVSTFTVGCLPGYATLGVWAPILLVCLRLIQGFAAGGEWGGAALYGTESAPPNRRGLWGSFTSMGIGLGSLLGTGVFALTSAAYGGNMADFGWRIPFWLGGLVVLVALVARYIVMEKDVKDAHSVPKIPLADAIRHRPKQLLLGLGVSYGYNTIAYVGFTFLLSYVTQFGYDKTLSLIAQLLYCAVIMISAPLAAYTSDRIGRKPMMVIGAISATAMIFGFFWMVSGGSVVGLMFGFAIAGFTTGFMQGPIPGFLSEQFPARIRYTGMSTAYQLGAAVGGGTAAMVAAWLLLTFDKNPVSVALYGAAAMLVLAVCSLLLKETSKMSLAEIDAGPGGKA